MTPATFMKGDRVIVHRDVRLPSAVHGHGEITCVWGHGSDELYDVALDKSSRGRVCYASELEHEPPVETLARAGTTP